MGRIKIPVQMLPKDIQQGDHGSAVNARTLRESVASRQYRSHHSPRRVRQPVVAAVVREGQTGVVEAKKMEDRGVQVVDVHAIDLGAKADGVGRAVRRCPP